MLIFQYCKLIGKIKKKNPMKIRDICKIEKEKLSFLVFLLIGIKNDFQYTFQKNTFKRHVDLFLIEKEG